MLEEYSRSPNVQSPPRTQAPAKMLADESTPLPCGPPVIQDRSLTLMLARLIILASRRLIVSDSAFAGYVFCAVGACTLTTVYLIIAVWASIHVVFSGQNNLPAHNRRACSFDIRLHPEKLSFDPTGKFGIHSLNKLNER